MKALIIEDEQFAASKLKGLLLDYDPDIEILDVIDSIEDAVEWFNTHVQPDLLFLDIHLADGLSFEIFDQVEVNCPIIFTTAYDQYAIRAFKSISVDYLLKPIKYGNLENALHKYKEMFLDRTNFGNSHDIHALVSMIQGQNKSFKSRFLVKMGNTIKSVLVSDIAYFVFEDRTTLLVTRDKHRYVVKHTLDEIEELLEPIQFTRANRQFIINFDAIHKIHPWFKGRLKLDLTPPQKTDLVISAERIKGFKEWLDR